MSVTTVGGLEAFTVHPSGIDQSVDLDRCPFCGSLAGYYDSSNRGDAHPLGVTCINTSCGVRTPKHYQSREAARAAWNRRATVTVSEVSK